MSGQSRQSECYDQYLALLQERNRKLRQKDSRQKELEKREQGFSLYLNGANLQAPKAPPTRKEMLTSRTKSSQRTSKTAGGRVVQRSDVSDEEQMNDRAKTAPSKRKSWSYDSVRVRAEEGDTVHMKAPGCLSGQYDEDFESPTGQPGYCSPEEDLEPSPEGSNTSRGESKKEYNTLCISQTFQGDSLSDQDDSSVGVTSDDQSCTEELESTGDLSPRTFPLVQLREPETVLEFESQSKLTVSLASLPSTIGNRATDLSVPLDRADRPANSTVTSVCEPQISSLPFSSHCSYSMPRQDNAVSVGSHTKPQAVRGTTQSLSAVRRKQNLPPSDEDYRSTEQAVLEAVSLENQALTTAGDKNEPHTIPGSANTSSEQRRPLLIPEQISKFAPTDCSQAPPTRAPPSTSACDNKESVFSVDEDCASKVTNSASSRGGPGGCKENSPHKPVLARSRFKSLDGERHSLCETAPLDNQPASRDGHKEQDTATSESLTEHTLSVITAKVREMDARKQRQLLQLLSRLNTPISSLSSPVTQPHTHSHTLTQPHTHSPTLTQPPAHPHPLTHQLPTFQAPSNERRGGKGNETQTPTSVSIDVPVWLEDHVSKHLQPSTLSTGDLATPPRPRSTRMSGLRGESLTQQFNLPIDRCSSSVSGRVSGLRGEMKSRHGNGINPLGSVSDSLLSGVEVGPPLLISTGNPCLNERRVDRSPNTAQPYEGDIGSTPSNYDGHIGSAPANYEGHLIGSTPADYEGHVIESTPADYEGRVIGSSPADYEGHVIGSTPADYEGHVIGSTPADYEGHLIGSTPANYEGPRLKTAVLAQGHRRIPLGDNGVDVFLLPPSIGPPRENKALSSTTPSQGEPEARRSLDVWQTRRSTNENLASINMFDHSHLGQIGRDLDEDILDSFLTEYREKREQRSHHSKATPPTPPLSLRTTVEVPNAQCEGTEFMIPELPTGSELVLNILSTWGDCFYVGLTGIEIYTDTGEMAAITEISADPSDINSLPEYDHDPRVVTNLLDGVNQTKDDLHMWLTPYSPGQDTTVRILFTAPTTLALIRIWNYNKSRIHSVRGVRLMEMTLDGDLIFHGEIRKGDSSEMILFTTDQDILYAVSQHDALYQNAISDCLHSKPTPLSPRPSTGDSLEANTRPFTSGFAPPPSLDQLQAQLEPEELDSRHFEDSLRSLLDSSQLLRELEPAVQDSNASRESPGAPFMGRFLRLCLVGNWGDSDYIGLTGIRVLSVDGKPLRLRSDQIQCEVEDQGSEVDNTAKRLLDGVFITTEPGHMWATPLHTSQPHTCTILTLSLDTPTELTGLRVWNYNTSLEDSYRGVKLMQVYLDDGVLLSPAAGFVVRRAPGHVEYDFGQLLSFHKVQGAGQQPEETDLPRGFIFQLQLLSTWGDPYYIGLNGIEVFDTTGHVIPLTTDNIAAYPDSVNILPGVSGDVRTPDKLIDGACDTEDGCHMWLAPILPGITNSVYVMFDGPCTMSEVAIWNYAKTPSRGVKELSVLVDGLLVYTGTVPSVPTHARGILPTLRPPLDPFLIPLCGGGACGVGSAGDVHLSESNDVQLTDNWQVLTHSAKPQKQIANQDLRPMTTLTNTQRNRRCPW